jgi:predicted amidohydrolase YtcJ
MGTAGSALAFTGGRVVTMDARTAGAEVVVVVDDRIAAVGPAELLHAHPDATTVDLTGRTLVPGFIDAHNHLSIAALQPRWHDVSGVADIDALVVAIRAQAAAEPEAAWVRCHGWNEVARGVAPTRHDLDAAGIERPVVVAHSTLHQCVVSSAALDVLGVGPGTADPPGGEIRRGPDGRPDGVLVERAWGEAHARSLAAYADPDRWADHIAARGRALVVDGITCVHDAACSPAAEAVYRSMVAAGELPISVVGLPHPAALLDNDLARRLDGPPTGDGDEWFRVGPAKLFADGGVAIALDTTISGHPVRYGMLFADLVGHAVAAAERGFRIAVHAIGNRGVDAALDAYTEVARTRGDGDHRFRLEHAGVTSARHWRRLAEVDAVAVVQPGFVEHVGEQSHGVTFDDHHWLAFAGLADAGVTLAGSSDDPCAPVSPLWGARLGASRRTSSGLAFELDQAVGVDDWLTAYTRGAAFAGGQETERGSISVGKRADFVVLDDADSPNPRVAETWISGRRVYASTRER